MAEKPQARGMPIPPGMSVPNGELREESIPMEPEIDEGLPEPTPEEAAQIDQGYDSIAERLEGANPEALPKMIGETAGRMLNREVQAARDGGVEISDGILMSVGAELVWDITKVAKNEDLLPSMSEKEEQQLQGEALIYATEKYVDTSPQPIDPAGPMRLAANALRGTYPGEQEIPRMGVPIQEEVITEEAIV